MGWGRSWPGWSRRCGPRRQDRVKGLDSSRKEPTCAALRNGEPLQGLKQSNMIENNKGRLFRQQILRCIETGRLVSRKAYYK